MPKKESKLEKVKNKYNEWLLKQNWLDKANVIAQPFEAGSRFGIGGGADWTNPITGLGAAAGAATFLPSAPIKLIQGSRALKNAGALTLIPSASTGITQGAKVLKNLGNLEKTALKDSKISRTLDRAAQVARGTYYGTQGARAGKALFQSATSGGNSPELTEPQNYTGAGDGFATNNQGGEMGTLSYGSGGGESGTVTDEWVTMAGELYNLANPDDRLRYFSDRMRLLEIERDNYIANVEDQIGRALTDAEQQRDVNLASIHQDIADTEAAAANYVRDYANQVNLFGASKNLGDVRRQQSFAQLAPNAFQSSQASSQDFANRQYLEGLGEMAAGAAENVGTSFMANPQDFSRLGTESVLGRQRANLLRERENIGSLYNRFVGDRLNDLALARQRAQDYINEQAGELTGSFAGIDRQQAVNPFVYTRQGYTPATLKQSDLSRFMPFTDFQGTTPSDVRFGTGFVPRRSSNLFSNETPLEAYLGSNELTESDKNYLRKYLLGRA